MTTRSSTVTVRVYPETLKLARLAARLELRTVSTLFEVAMLEYLKNHHANITQQEPGGNDGKRQ